MTTALYAGSFDPFTNGHMEILKSGAEIFDKVIIAIAYNASKQSFLPISVRKELIEKCVKDLKNVEVEIFDGLTVDFAKKCKATVLLRGVRSNSDYEYENQLANVNYKLNPKIRTVLLSSSPEYSFISSSAVKEILQNNGDISAFVPKEVEKYLKLMIKNDI